jgi:hypothetical protein
VAKKKKIFVDKLFFLHERYSASTLFFSTFETIIVIYQHLNRFNNINYYFRYIIALEGNIANGHLQIADFI